MNATLLSKDRHALVAILCARSPEARLLQQELKEIQGRLGRPTELPDDGKQAGVIAHKLNNMLCALVLSEPFDL